MTIALRDYQKECLETVLTEFRIGTNRQLISLPTGSGKTIVMAAIAKHVNKKILIIAHREELIQQALEKIKLYWPNADLGVCMADRNEIENRIVVGSVQSCSRPKRLEQLKEQNFQLLMIDEAHHASADTYQSIIENLGFNQGKLLIGVTATPERADNEGLDHIFDKVTYTRSIGTMIKAGYLSPVIGRKILTSFVLNKIRTRNGDYALDDLSEAVNTPERNAFIAQKYNAYASSRLGIAFCVDVQHCKDLAETMRKNGIKSEAVYGDMAKDERKRILDEFKGGRIQVVTSCGILTEGFDEPTVSAVAMCRPTKSRSLYIQCVGRGLRLFPGKEDCLVLDFTDRGHNLDSVISLKNTIPEAIHVEEREPVEIEERDKIRKIESLFECDQQFDILGTTRFLWVSLGDNEWSLIDDERREIVMQPEDEGYTAVLYFPSGESKTIVKTPLPLEYCSGVCEDYARQRLKLAFADASKPWMKGEAQPTLGQLEYLQKQGAYREGMNKGEASIAIRKIVALKNKQRRFKTNEPITDMQKYFLSSRGIDIKNMSKLIAKQIISKIKQTESVNHGHC